MKEKSCKKIITVLLILVLTILDIFIVSKQIIVNAKEEQKINIEAEIEGNLNKYINYKISDEDKGTLVQYDLKIGMKYEEKEDNPIKENRITINLEKIDGKFPYDVKTLTKSTKATNGKISDFNGNYEYNQETGTLIITQSNQNENGEIISNSKPNENDKDEYVVICYYDTYTEEQPEREFTLKGFVDIIFATKDDKKINKDIELDNKVTGNIGELTSLNSKTDEIYNGYIKSNIINGTQYATQYRETQELIISKKEAHQKLTVKENNVLAKAYTDSNGEEQVQELGNNGELIYRSTKIRKDEIKKVLGEHGKLEILDKIGNVLATIDENTQFAEDGTITITYQNDIDEITIKTSDIVDEGILHIENTKEIKNTMKNIEKNRIITKSKIVGIKEEILELPVSEEINTTQEKSVQEKETYKSETSYIVDIKEAKTNINMNLDKTEWTNKQQNEVVFDIYLDSSSIKDNMFKNPSLRINIPSQVEKIILGNSTIVYGNGLELQQPYIEEKEDGTLDIVVYLTGKQLQYDENNLGLLTNIRIPATIILKKDIENASADLNLSYTNNYGLGEKAEEGTITKKVQIQNYEEENNTNEENNGNEGNAGKEEIPEKPETPEMSENDNSANNTVMPEDLEKIELEISPVKGDVNLKNGDTVYEGEFIKYNIKVKNKSDKDVSNLKVVGTIPEGATYGELYAEFDRRTGKYEYKFDETLKEKIIDIGTLKAGQEYNGYFEVKIDDIEENMQEKELMSEISIFAEKNKLNTFEIKNIVKKAESKIFVKSYIGNTVDYWVYELNLESNSDEEIEVNLKLPKEFDLDDVWKSSSKIEYEENTEENSVTIRVPKGTYYVGGNILNSSIDKNNELGQVELVAVATAKINSIDYKSNENRLIYKYFDTKIEMASSNEGQEVEYGEEINYDIEVSVEGSKNIIEDTSSIVDINILDYLPSELEPISVTYETWKEEIDEKTIKYDENNNIEEFTPTGKYKKTEVTETITKGTVDDDGNRIANVDLLIYVPVGEVSHITIKTKAGLVYEKTVVENSIIVNSDKTSNKISNKVTHTIIPYESEIPVDPEEPVDPPVDPPIDPPVDPENPDKNKHSISGVAWLDKDEDGKRDLDEKLLEGITVYLVDMNDSGVVKEKILTNSSGKYIFKNLEKSDYVVIFQYDTNMYYVTEYQKAGVDKKLNSDATKQKLTLNGKQIEAGVTDIIKLKENQANIDLGLVENKTFDLKIDKYITKVTVKTNTQTKVYSYDNEKLAKIEINAKELQGAKVTVDYKIQITNEGEVPGTVEEIKDYLPYGFELSSADNQMWNKQKDGTITNNTLMNEKIDKGESISIGLSATKTIDENSTGSFVNSVEIIESGNSKNIPDVDSIPNNKNESEDDFSKAELIISIGTGAIVVYISIFIIIAMISVLGVYFIKKYGMPKKVKTMFLVIFALGITIFVNVGEVFADAPAYANFTWCINGGIDYKHAYLCGHGYNNYYGSYHFTGGVNGGEGFCHNPNLNPAGFNKETETASSVRYTFTGQYIDDVSYKSTEYYVWNGNSWSKVNQIPSNIISMAEGYSKINIKTIDENIVLGPLKINTNIYNGGYTIKVIDSSNNTISGVESCDSLGNNIDVKGTMEFYLKVPKDNVKTGVKLIEVAPLGENNTGNVTKTVVKEYKMGSAVYNPGGGLQTVNTINKIVHDEKVKNSYGKTNSVVWTDISGSLDIIKVDSDNNNVVLPEVQIRVENSEIGYNETFTTDSNGKIHVDNLMIGTYTIIEIINNNYGYSEIEKGQVTIPGGGVITYNLENEKQTGNLKIQKRDMDRPEVGLSGVTFKIKNSKGQYIIAVDDNGQNQTKVVGKIHLGNMKTIANINEATEFVTGEDGNVEIFNILADTYEVVEISVGDDYGYEVDSDYISWESGANSGNGLTATVEVVRQSSNETSTTSSSKNTVLTVKNRKKYIKLSGKVWEDVFWEIGKQKHENDLYQETTEDINDKLLENIVVRLKDSQGNNVTFKNEQRNDVQEVKTDENGKYLMEDIQIDNLDEYYVEFSYNGIAYESVKLIDINKENGTQAIEGNNRTDYNNNFAVITHENGNGQSNNSNGQKVNDISYKIEEYKSIIDYEGNYEYGYEPSKVANMTEEEYKTYYPVNGISDKYIISATTYNAYKSVGKSGYLSDIKTAEEVRKEGIEEIDKGMDLGIKKRERPDISVVKDLKSASVSINNETHIYEYNDRFNTEGEFGNGYGYDMDSNMEDKFSTGVAFEEKYGNMSYTRALYPSDIKYEGTDELEVKVTYKIGVKNTATNLKAQIYQLQDYYDTKYELVKVGLDINDDGSIKEEAVIDSIEQTLTGGNGQYQMIEIGKTSGKPLFSLEPQTEGAVYVELKVKQQNLIDIVDLGQEVKLDNIAEVSAYGNTKINEDGKEEIYAGIDKDSQPGNLNVEDKTTWEDDTDRAPGLKIILQEAREVSGKVFEDTDKNPLDIAENGQEQRTHKGIERQGNGQLDEDEKGIQGVKVQLIDANGELAKVWVEDGSSAGKGKWQDAEVTTDENGEYTFKGFIPGDYTIKYTWGDEKYKVQNYKSTIVNEEVWRAKNSDSQWYKEEFKQKYDLEWRDGNEIRNSDAVDNYDMRMEVDNQITDVTYGEKQKIENAYSTEVQSGNDIMTKMMSATPTFKVNVEYDTDKTNPRDEYQTDENGKLILDNNGNLIPKDQFKNNITSIDLGLIERARQILELDKHITSVKIMLANGNILLNAILDEDGNVIDSTDYVSVIPKSLVNGQIRIEIDEEIIQGAKLEVEYNLKVTNISELDYQTQEFYMYGKGYGEIEEKLITQYPSLIIDYLDSDLVTDIEENSVWEGIAKQERKEKLIDTGLLAEELGDTLVEYNKVLTTDEIKDVELKPIGNKDETSVSVQLEGYKLLSTNDEEFSENNAEIITATRNKGGAILTTIPGNYIPGEIETEEDNSPSERIIIIPPTGLETNYITYIMLVISSLGILTGGILLIKKYVLDKK